MIASEVVAAAERVARRFQAKTLKTRGARSSVYLVLLHDARHGGRWGLYVGQTARDPDERFDQHKAGYKASGVVRRFGVRLLPTIVAHLNPMSAWEAVEIEAALAEALSQAGIAWIEGGH